MKIFNIIPVLLIFMAHSAALFAQHPTELTSDGDTTIVVSKEIARRLAKEYSNVNEV